MGHGYLVLAYALTWAVQLGYAGFLAVKWRSEKRAERERPGYDARG